jgi:DUF2075 family protein
MLLKTVDFVDFVQSDLSGLIDSLTERTGRATPFEIEAWRSSLPHLSKILAEASKLNKNFSNTHLYLGHLTLEYRLPSSSSWCDAVLMGKNSDGKQCVYIIELKDWDVSTDSVGFAEGLITHKGNQWNHPSDQLKGYVNYCKRFHSAVESYSANVTGCAFITKSGNIQPYLDHPNSTLVNEFPIFNLDNSKELAQNIVNNIYESDNQFAIDFEKGYYKQNRNILRQVAEQIQSKVNGSLTPYELLDEQRKGFNLVMGLLEEINRSGDKSKKHVIIVEGPPGSGKSALAINLWIESVMKFITPDKKIKKLKTEIKSKNLSKTENIVFVTTSSSQKSNWQSTFQNLAPEFSGQGFILSSNQYNPGISGSQVKRLRDLTGKEMLVKDWEENISTYFENGGDQRSMDNLHFISVVDEAHALINTEGHNIGFSSGWCLQAGPQAYHVIRSSQITVFFTDGKQSYRDSETTTIDNLEDFSRRLNAEIHKISLEGSQFRCGGSKEYIEFVENLLDNDSEFELDTSWRKTSENESGVFDFEIVDFPHQIDEKLQSKIDLGLTARIISSYSREWITKKESIPHNVAPHLMDFHFNYESNSKEMIYSKPWNYAPGEDYSMFIQAPLGSRMNDNQLCEVGCPYVVRGFDYDYLGLLWLDDLVYRNGKWCVLIENVKETALSQTMSRAKIAIVQKEKSGSKDLTEQELVLLDKIIKGYRILLSRALKGMYLYVHDEETKQYLTSILN